MLFSYSTRPTKGKPRNHFLRLKSSPSTSSGFCDILLAMAKVRSVEVDTAKHYCQSYRAASAPERLLLIEIYWR